VAANDEHLSHVDVYALQVTDDESYLKYRAAMMPLLHAMGGTFGFDLKVAEVLKNPTSKSFNRVFSMAFASVDARNAFFEDARYLQIRATYFERAVADRTHLGQLQPGVPLP
jgi:uncharacterized protein (DUF1330 family)